MLLGQLHVAQIIFLHCPLEVLSAENPGLFAKPLFASLAFALLVLAGCGSSGDSTESSSAGLPKEIVIGAAIAKTGYLAP